MATPRRNGEQLDLLGDGQQMPVFVLSLASPGLQARVRAQVQKVMDRPENQWIARSNVDRVFAFDNVNVDRYVYGKAIANATTAALAVELGIDPDQLRWSW